MMKKCKEKDPFLALLEYRTTPIPGIELSPSQMLNSRRLRSKIPMATNLLIPHAQPDTLKGLQNRQKKQKYFHDKTALKKPLKEFWCE